MQYILHDQDDGIDYASYLAYLQTIRPDLPGHLYDFASNPAYFDLASPSSLHDAWLEALVVREVASGSRNEIRKLAVDLSLLGPYHDRRIHLAYSGVTHYALAYLSRSGDPHAAHVAHGDLLTHEIRLVRNGLFVHEILFDTGATLRIEFSGFSHREEPME